MIDSASFFLNVVRLTLRHNCSARKFIKLLSEFVRIDRQLHENSSERAIMPGKFKYRTYMQYRSIRKMFLIHTPMTPMQGINSLLVIYNLSLLELLQIESALCSISAVIGFSFSYVEFTWDFYPNVTALELQRKIGKYAYLKGAKSAFEKGKDPRKTLYINSRKNSTYLKCYNRPKDINDTSNERVRLELTVNDRRWFVRYQLFKPSDFLQFDYSVFARNILWKTFAYDAIRKSLINFMLENTFDGTLKEVAKKRIVNAILFLRNLPLCSEKCNYRLNSDFCHLNEVIVKDIPGAERLNVIRRCPESSPQSNVIQRFFKPARFGLFMNDVMRKAYEEWRNDLQGASIATPLFPVQITFRKVNKKRVAKKERASPMIKESTAKIMKLFRVNKT